MIDNLTLRNFKCFGELNLEFSNLNVLAGINSTGKSSLIQSLLLLRQAFDMGHLSKGLHLNGNITNIGIGQDLLYDGSDEDEIEISLTSDGNVSFWKYKYEADADYLRIASSNIDQCNISNLNLFSSTFSYVAADRIGPQRYYKKSYHDIYDNNQIGYKGDLFVDYIAERGLKDKVTNEHVIHPNVPSHQLLYQTDGWLSEISPGVNLEPKNYPEAGLVNLGYKINASSHAYSPLNVGFGVSYAAPIVISLLKAKNGDLIILENPEAHLHPKGQRKMGELIALACSGGVQVILETHSDHLLNGVRLAVKRTQINRNQVRLNYFYVLPDGKKIIHTKSSIAILEDGSLSSWPDGFFDEWDKAIDELF